MRAPAQFMCHSGLRTVPPAPGASDAFPSKAAFCPQGCKPPAASLVVTSLHLYTPHPWTSRPLERVWLQRSPRFALGLGGPGSHKEDPQMLWFLQWLFPSSTVEEYGGAVDTHQGTALTRVGQEMSQPRLLLQADWSGRKGSHGLSRDSLPERAGSGGWLGDASLSLFSLLLPGTALHSQVSGRARPPALFSREFQLSQRDVCRVTSAAISVVLSITRDLLRSPRPRCPFLSSSQQRTLYIDEDLAPHVPKVTSSDVEEAGSLGPESVLSSVLLAGAAGGVRAGGHRAVATGRT